MTPHPPAPMPNSPAIDHARLLEIRANTRYSGLRTALYALRWFGFLSCGTMLIVLIKDLLPLLRYMGGVNLSNLLLLTAPVHGALGVYVMTGLVEAILDRIDCALTADSRDAES